MERKETLRENEAKSLEAYLDSQSKKFDMLKDFVVDGYSVDEKLLSAVQIFQDRGLEAYERYTKVQRELASKLQSINVLNEVDNKVAINDNFAIQDSKEVKKLVGVIPNEVIDSIDINDPKSVKRFEIKATSRDEISRGVSKLPTTGTIIIIGKEDEYVKELSSYLKSKGLLVVLIDSIIKEENSAKEIIEELSKITQISGMIAVGNAFAEEIDEEKAYDYFITIAYLTKYILGYIRENKNLVNPLIMFNSFMDGKLGITGNYDNYLYASFTGFAKSLGIEQAIELPGLVNVKLIDFEKTMTTKEMIKAFEDELCCTDMIFEIGRTKDGSRHVLEAYVTKSVVTENKCPFTKDDVVLVTGGSRGVTAECITELAKRAKTTYVILGRANITSEYADDAETSKITEVKEMKSLLARRLKEAGQKVSFIEIEKKAKAILAQRDMIKNFDTMKALGVNVHYYSCDVSNKDAVAKTINTIQLEVGTITGIIHGAGIIFDQKMHHKNMDNFKRVYDTKYKGLNYIMKNINKDKLKFLVMYSSISGYFGNDGQCDYSAGNSYFDKYAYYLNKKYPNCKTLSINWGAWAGGMLDMTYSEAMIERGYVLIPLQIGANYFANEFLMGLPSRQIMITHDGNMGH